MWQAFGWCPNGPQCPLSHDTDLIILQDEKGKQDKRKKRKRNREKRAAGEVAEDSILESAPENKMPHMEVDPEERGDGQQETNVEPCEEGNKDENMKTDSEGNGVCERNTHSKNENTKTYKNVENAAVEGAIEKRSDPSAKTVKNVDTGTHRAGFDAFMTGYIFAYSCTAVKKDGAEVTAEEKEQTWLPTALNKVYLSGKAAPLNVVKSTFSKSSKAHVQKMEMVWGK